MSNEIELKFEIECESIDRLVTFFNRQPMLKQQSLQLSNTYYDTADQYLKNHQASVRIRGTKTAGGVSQYEITVKSAGKALAGLHERAEFNADLPNNQLNLSVLPKQAFPFDVDITSLSSQLVAQFATDFYRRTWLVDFKQSQIEIALDEGNILSGKQSCPILEIELELKQGNQLDLIGFAVELSQFNVHLFSQSKAARGYRLMQGSRINKIDHLFTNDALSLSVLPDVLQYWQNNEEYALANNDLTAYQATLNAVQSTLTAVLHQADEGKLTLLSQVYLHWCEKIRCVNNLKEFAYSAINTKLKLYLMLLLFKA